MPLHRPCRYLLLLTLLLLGASGCAASRANVAGQVTIEGKAPTDQQCGLVVSFIGNDGLPITAPVDAEGRYNAANVLVGPNRVTVYWVPPPGEAAAPKSRTGSGQQAKAALSPIPERYRDPNQSQLKCDVVGGQNDFPINLLSK